MSLLQDQNSRYAEILSLENSMIKIPYEMMNKRFRVTQKTLDREAAQLSLVAKELECKLAADDCDRGEVRRLLGNVAERFGVFKRKAEECFSDELKIADLCKRRMRHLLVYGDSDDSHVISEWRRLRFDRFLVDHLVREQQFDLARKLATASNISHLTNIDIFVSAEQVLQNLQAHKVDLALAWCHENRSKLRRNKSKLELFLLEQEFIELIKANRRIDAVWYARKHLTSSDIAICATEELQSCLALLAYPLHTQIEPYATLLSDNRWRCLIEEFRRDNYRIYQLPTNSPFSSLVQSGIIALKTHECYHKKTGASEFSDCPVCEPPFNQLAETLPFAHCTQSHLRCGISGDPINEMNPPLMLPNGNIYGSQALYKMAREMDSRIICPRTQEVFFESQLEKVFIM